MIGEVYPGRMEVSRLRAGVVAGVVGLDCGSGCIDRGRWDRRALSSQEGKSTTGLDFDRSSLYPPP
jgi:hypothetical protein